MPVLRALIADDEPLARARLRRLLEADGGVDVVAECLSGGEAIRALQRQQPDVAFVDVRMPEIDGFDVARQALSGSATQLVFVTAYAEHALRAFEAAAVDYLLKPLSRERLAAALQRVRRRREERGGPRTADPAAAVVRLAVPSGNGVHLLAAGEIEHVVARANYVDVHAGGRVYRLRETMAALEARLAGPQFVRAHRSVIVRVDAVRDIEILDSGRHVLHLASGARVAAGRAYRERLRAALGLGAR